MHHSLPVLYSFRRCPYAIRARMAIRAANLAVELREVVLKDKPPELSAVSPKATVPVLTYFDLTQQRQVGIEQSIDIMLWALKQNDPHNWLGQGCSYEQDAAKWIEANDRDFKHWLDRYKYADRFPEHAEAYYRDQAFTFILQVQAALEQHEYLLGDKCSLSDVAVFPFVRQFAQVDKAWFDQSVQPGLLTWLNHFLQGELFLSVMQKTPQWQRDSAPVRM